MINTPVTVFWFRRDLRLDDNAALYHALRSGYPVLPLFIFDTAILDELDDKADARVEFIHNEVVRLAGELQALGSGLLVKTGRPADVWKQLLADYKIVEAYANHDYESYGIARDKQIGELLAAQGAVFKTFKDVVVFEKDEVVKDDGTPYTVFTPYSKKWKARLSPFYYKPYPVEKYSQHFKKAVNTECPTLGQLGFKPTEVQFPKRLVQNSIIKQYTESRDFPAKHGTSQLSLHLRFGTLSIRRLLAYALPVNDTYVNELIWRDFYHQILWHFPQVEKQAFKPLYDTIVWENNEELFDKWCMGQTGVPMVDAGMRQLNATGYMHNRVRMIVASFLCKNLLIDWRWGEAYFAQKLLDFDLAANNGGWQWAAGCGTDAAPYFRIFNPYTQAERFDPDGEYRKKWLPEWNTSAYPEPIIDVQLSRDKCLKMYKKALAAENYG